MDNIKPDFIENGGAEPARIPLRCLGADEYLPMLERDHISRATHVHEFRVQAGDARI